MEKIYQAPADVEIAGSAATSMIHNIATEDIASLAEKHGLNGVTVEDWVPLSKMCALFNDVAASVGGGAEQVFIGMGMRIAEQSEVPPEMRANLTLPVMLMGWNDHYNANHRGGNLPDIISRKIGEREYELHMEGKAHPYPYNMTYGMVYGFCRTLLPQNTTYHVVYEEQHSPYSTWENGVIIRVTWE